MSETKKSGSATPLLSAGQTTEIAFAIVSMVSAVFRPVPPRSMSSKMLSSWTIASPPMLGGGIAQTSRPL